ncbi:unnamed protein product [Bemisia tabaci]|uniref:Major facilitator superfamily (MFS) profile domain-containing protein n=1 Tax=Bemisia tabaci TaxID=7038 RepID=A0A9P0F3C3_BEMTA|nr:unnamed protein product [Bemisia tabaci]
MIQDSTQLVSAPNSPFSTPTRIKQGWTSLLMFCAFSTIMGLAIPMGYGIGVINTPADVIRAWCNETLQANYDVVLTDKKDLDLIWSVIVSVFLLSGVVGSFIGGWLANLIGRKGAMLVSCLLSTVAGLCFLSPLIVNRIELLFAGRAIVGLSAGLGTAVVPMYLLEIAPTKLQGSIATFFSLGITIGVLLGQILGLNWLLGGETRWPYLLSAYILCVLFCLLTFPCLPESPKYLFSVKNERQSALQALSRLRGLPADLLQSELDSKDTAENNFNNEEIQTWSVAQVLRTRSLLLPLALVIALQAGQQFAGINAVFFYSSDIFKSAGLDETSREYAVIGTGCVNLGVNVIAVFTLKYFTRRFLVLLSCYGTVLSLLLLTLCSHYMQTVSWLPNASIAVVMLYVFMYGVGLGPIPYFIGSELFAVGPRPIAMAFGSFANWGGNFLVSLTFTTFFNYLAGYSFLIFAGSTMLLSIFIHAYLPETKNSVASL